MSHRPEKTITALATVVESSTFSVSFVVTLFQGVTKVRTEQI